MLVDVGLTAEHIVQPPCWGGCRQAALILVLMGVFPCSPLGATKVALGTENPHFSNAAGQPLSGAYTEPWSPGEGEMV